MTREITDRRQFLKSGIATTAVISMAGCSSNIGGGGGGDIEVSDEAQGYADDLPDYYPDDYGEVVQGAMDEGSLTMYVAHFGSLSDSYVSAFNERFPFVEVEVVNLASAKVFERFSQEARQDVWEPDLVHSSDPVALGQFEQLEIIQNYDSPEQEYIRDGYVSESGQVVAPTYMPYVHAWHPPELDDPPMSLPEIASAVEDDPESWNGNFCIYDGVLSTAMWQMMYLWSDHYGREEMEEHLRTLAEAEPRSFWSTSTMGEWVASNEVQFGLNIADFILATSIRSDYSEEDIQWGPDQDVLFNAFYGGFVLPQEVENSNAARLFYDWWLSEEGQSFLANEWRLASAREDMSGAVESTFNIPGGDDIALTYNALEEISPTMPDYRELSQAGESKTEFKNLWYEIFVAGA